MIQKKAHTWDRYLHYHCCPQCSYIIESREDYDYRLGGKYQKKLICPRCGHNFCLTKVNKLSIAPFIGKGEPIEVEWGD